MYNKYTKTNIYDNFLIRYKIFRYKLNKIIHLDTLSCLINEIISLKISREMYGEICDALPHTQKEQ